jgi:hypothetical protein
MTIVGYGFDAAANKSFYLIKNSWGIIDPWTGGPGWGEMVSSRAAPSTLPAGTPAQDGMPQPHA